MVQKMKKKLSDMLTARKENSNKGFTLVELIVVIVILAILIGVTIGGVFGYVNKSRINTDINNAASIQSVCSTLASDKALVGKAATYTLKWDNTVANTDIAGNCADTVVKSALDDRIKKLLTDGLPAPKAGGSFKLEITANDDNITVTCKAYKDGTAAQGTLLEAQE